jgi:hypothetical protein
VFPSVPAIERVFVCLKEIYMRTNVVKPTPAVFNNEGIRAVNKSPEDQL